ncbi:fungal hydrophobin domain-containing protein [Penicillium maclennaniae]|uniref:fungal hydrophobin domain-containing protein n=1 Tax=Penicillium maclennaniae TaxID=1343394 RepID=UPI00254202A2|nr:fungal hydrophobin domain-containing protein [Penicillium maclennaniae]KAJ5674443.1 fungal hydrophobin domain-containing protein [Penicillium maclennaniae]
MKASILLIAASAGAALAQPAALTERGSVCPTTLYSIPSCCTTSVLDVATLDCHTPSSAIGVADFKSSCAGAMAKCCTVPAATLDVLCTDVVE